MNNNETLVIGADEQQGSETANADDSSVIAIHDDEKLTATDVSALRRAKVRDLMQRQGKSVKDILDSIGLEGKDRKNLQQLLYSIRSDTRITNLSPERAEVLAPALNVDSMTLLVALTNKEKKRMGQVLESGDGMSESKLQSLRSKALDAVMDEHQLSAQDIAQLLETEEFQQSVVADEIASSRTGETLLSDELASKIVRELQLRAEDFGIGQKPSVRQTTIPTTTRRGGGRRKQATRKTTESSGDLADGETVETTLEMDVDELRQFFGDKMVQVVKKESGRRVLRLESSITKDELLELVLKKLSK